LHLSQCPFFLDHYSPERTCYIQHTTGSLQGHEQEISSSDAFLVLGRGGAAQIARQAFDEMGVIMPVKIGLNSVGHLDTVVAGKLAIEQCQEFREKRSLFGEQIDNCSGLF
jgi:hypothetical protein